MFTDEQILAVTKLDGKDLNYLKRVILQVSVIGKEDLLSVAVYDLLGTLGISGEARTFLLLHWKGEFNVLGRAYTESKTRARRTLFILDNAYATLDGDGVVLDLKELVEVALFPEPVVGTVLYLPELFQRVLAACERLAGQPPVSPPTQSAAPLTPAD